MKSTEVPCPARAEAKLFDERTCTLEERSGTGDEDSGKGKARANWK